MKRITIVTLAVALPLLSACVVEEHRHGPGRRPVVINSYDYDDDNDWHDHHRGYRHCPPGQAKKGRC